MKVLFFGCIVAAGHHLWVRTTCDGWPRIRTTDPKAEGCPWTLEELDPLASMARDAWCVSFEEQREGDAVLSRKNGWTRLGWPDRSIDSRRGSHADLLIEGEHSFEQMIALGREHFQERMRRMDYPIRLARTVV